LSFLGSPGDGFLGRFIHEQFNYPPEAHAGEDQSVRETDENGTEPVILDASDSSDPGDFIASYVWSEGGGGEEIATGIRPRVILDEGARIITLTVTDELGAIDTDMVQITVMAE
jgi:hypothetical protein